MDKVEGGQHRTCRALFKNNFSEQLHSQAAEEKEKAHGTQAETVFNLQNRHSPNAEARAALCTTSQLSTSVVPPSPYPPHAAREGHEDKHCSCSSRGTGAGSITWLPLVVSACTC